MLAALMSLSLALPGSFVLGGDEAANAPALAQMCDSQDRRVLDPASLPLAQDSYVQIDCQGFAYQGAERTAEFIFADGQLTHVWVLVEAAELDPLTADFTRAYGQADVVAEQFTAWFNARAAVRRDIPEALYYSEAAAPLFEAWFTSNG